MSRIRNGSRLAAGIIGFTATLAVAFFIGNFLGDGSHTGTVGSKGNGTKTLPINLSFPDGELTPTHAVPLTAKVSNTTAVPVKFTHISLAVTSATPGCEASWFSVK